jgi:hypothetical protein
MVNFIFYILVVNSTSCQDIKLTIWFFMNIESWQFIDVFNGFKGFNCITAIFNCAV